MGWPKTIFFFIVIIRVVISATTNRYTNNTHRDNHQQDGPQPNKGSFAVKATVTANVAKSSPLWPDQDLQCQNDVAKHGQIVPRPAPA